MNIAALWEIHNHSAVKGVPLPAAMKMAESKDIHTKKIRKQLAKKLNISVPTAHFIDGLERFMNFDSNYGSIVDLFEKAQLTEIVLLVAFAKFYAVLAKVVYEERAARGITNKRVGSGPLKTAWSARNTTLTEYDRPGRKAAVMDAGSGQRAGDQEVIELRGENLALMNSAIELFKANSIGLYSGLVEKAVAIDEGHGVLLRWGTTK